MAVTSPALAQEARLATATVRRRRFNLERLLSPLLLAPSAVVIFIFVYGFIGYTFFVSLTNWKSAKPDMTIHRPVGAIYPDLVQPNPISDRSPQHLRLHRRIPDHGRTGRARLWRSCSIGIFTGSGFFRSIFLFPYALSFITTGVVWRWIFNPETGVNALFDATGINNVLAAYGVGPLKPGWITDPSRRLASSMGRLPRIFPPAGEWSLKLGIPVAMIAVVIAAAWQLSGFAMAMYLAGLGTISHEVQEAALARRSKRLPPVQGHHHPAPQADHDQRADHPDARLAQDLRSDLRDVREGAGVRDRRARHIRLRKIFRAQQYNFGAAASIVMLVAVSRS